MAIWSKIPPSSVGFYWFYGLKSPLYKKSCLMLVEVMQFSNKIGAFSEGNFFYFQDKLGWWLPCELPNINNLEEYWAKIDNK